MKVHHRALCAICAITVLAFAAVAGAEEHVSLTKIGEYATGVFDESAAEIVAFDPETQRAFVVNGDASAVDILDLSDPENPVKSGAIDVSGLGDGVNSVAVKDGLVAVAIENEDSQAAGVVGLYDTDGGLQAALPAGALPDMVTFSPNGDYVLAANEGEPNDEYTVDPEGSITLIDISGGVESAEVHQLGFTAFNDQMAALQAMDIRIFGPGATVAMDLEPEYIAVSEDSKWAWCSLQENNAVAAIDIENKTITAILPLGLKDFSVNSLDPSNRDAGIVFNTFENLVGMYQPDSISTFTMDGEYYLVTANEGDARDYDGYSEETRVADLTLDPATFPDAATLQDDAVLGRLKTTTANGDTDGDGDYDMIYAYGGRSMSIYRVTGSTIEQVSDTSDMLERITATQLPENFNSTDNENDSFDNRSDDKGPEPEALAVAKVDGRVFAFLGLERVGGVMVFEITDPAAPEFLSYVNTRDFQGDPEAGTAGDLAPEGIAVVKAGESPNGEPLLLVAYEVSGTTSVFRINNLPDDDDDSGCVFNPAATLGLEWLLLALAPLAWSVRRRFFG